MHSNTIRSRHARCRAGTKGINKKVNDTSIRMLISANAIGITRRNALESWLVARARAMVGPRLKPRIATAVVDQARTAE